MPEIAEGSILEITSPRKITLDDDKTFTMRNDDVTIVLSLIEQKQVGDAWVITGKVVTGWPAKSQN